MIRPPNVQFDLPQRDINGPLEVCVRDSTIEDVTDALILCHTTDGVVASGFGVGIRFDLESDTTEDRPAGAIHVAWTSHLDPGTSDMKFMVYDSGTRSEVLRLRTQVVDISASTAITGLSSVDNASLQVLSITANYAGTPANGFGSYIQLSGKSSTSTGQDMADIKAEWVDVTHATRSSDLIFYAYYTGTAREGMRIRGGSSNTQIGFLGATPVSRQGNTTDLKDVLVNFGFLTDGGATPLVTNDGEIACGDLTATTAQIVESDAVTNTTTTVFTVSHRSTGTPAAGFGSETNFRLESSTTEDRLAAQILVTWVVATDASRTGRITINAYDSAGAAREGVRIEGSGSATLLGFYGTAAVAQPSSTGETTGFTGGAGTAVRNDSTFTGNVGATAYRISDIVKHLKNLGLIAQ